MKQIVSILLIIVMVLGFTGLATADNVKVQKVAFDQESITIAVGKEVNLKTVIEPKNAKNKKLEWSSSDESIVTVKNGRIRGIDAGEAIVTAKAADGSDAKADIKITVTKPVKKITAQDSKIMLAPETTWEIVLEYMPEDATILGVDWKSTDARIASVDENGIVTGHKKGNCKLVGTAKDGSGSRVQINVAVKTYDVVITKPGITEVDFDTTYTNTISSISIPGYSRTIRYERTVTFGNGVVTEAGERKVKPVKAGEGTIEIKEKNNGRGHKTKKTVYVAQSAMKDPEFEGNQYEVVIEKCTWPEAKARCEDKGGHLVTIGSKEEQKFLEGILSSGQYWIGLCRDADDKFCWVTGESLEYTNWGQGEPNNYRSSSFSGENVVAMRPDWNDYNEKDTQNIIGYICEFEGEKKE